MSRTRMLLLALLSLTLSAVAAAIAYRAFQRRLVSAHMRFEPIVVAAARLSLGTRIGPEHVRTVPWPRGAAVEGGFSDPQAVLGRGVIVPIVPNEPVLESKLAPRGGGAGLTAAIPEGMRAMAVKVNEVIGVGGFVLPGSRVDVILTGSPDERNETDTAKVILENIQVLAAGRNIESSADGKPQDVAVVTLLVTPEDAQKLSLASAGGRIQLALRNPMDLQHENPRPVKRTALYLGSEPPPRPTRAPRALPPAERPAPPPPIVPASSVVELIQGNKRETWTFEAQ